MRAVVINLRAKPEQRDLIDQAETLLGRDRSDFMLEAACERASERHNSRPSVLPPRHGPIPAVHSAA